MRARDPASAPGTPHLLQGGRLLSRGTWPGPWARLAAVPVPLQVPASVGPRPVVSAPLLPLPLPVPISPAPVVMPLPHPVPFPVGISISSAPEIPISVPGPISPTVPLPVPLLIYGSAVPAAIRVHVSVPPPSRRLRVPASALVVPRVRPVGLGLLAAAPASLLRLRLLLGLLLRRCPALAVVGGRIVTRGSVLSPAAPVPVTIPAPAEGGVL